MKYGLGISSNSRKAGLLLAVFVILGFGITLMIIGSRAAPIAHTITAAAREASIQKIIVDSDSDGLKDWEEELYHTDPRVADTDADGTPDGEEILLGRNPIIHGPEDIVTTSTTDTPSAIGASSITSQFVDRIGKDFLIPFLQNPSLKLNTEKIADTIVADAFINPVSRSFTERDIIRTDTTKESITRYAQALTNAIRTSMKGLSGGAELEILSLVLQTEEYEKLSALDAYVSAYTTLVARAQKIPVPQDFVSLHVQFINMVSQEASAVAAMRRAEKDIIGAIKGAKDFSTAYEALQGIAKQFANMMSSHNIVL